MREEAEEKLMQFLQTRLEPFTLTALLGYLGEPRTLAASDDLAGFLMYNQMAYMNPSLDGDEELWITRAGLFTGQPITVIPLKDEIASGVLVPGSRFVPFYDPILLPHQLSFTFQGKTLGRTLLEASPDEIYPRYQLFGDEYAPQYLSLDNEENAALFSGVEFDDPVSVTVSAIDMRELYWATGFQPGDRIIARPTDWARGVFELAALPASRIDAAMERRWLADFEDVLIKSFEIGGPGASIDDQLAFAYFLGMESLFTPFSPGIAELLRRSSRIGFEPYGVESRLWLIDEPIPAQATWAMTLVTNPETMAEDALMHLGLPVNSLILDSYVLDALFRREPDVSAMLERMIPVRQKNSAFCLPIIERAAGFRMRHYASTYNWFADHETGTLRNRCVTLHSALMSFILSLQQGGIQPDFIPDQGAVILSQLMSHTISALENIDFGTDRDPPDQESLWASVEGMEDSFFDVKTAIQELLPELNKKRFSVIKKKEVSDE